MWTGLPKTSGIADKVKREWEERRELRSEVSALVYSGSHQKMVLSHEFEKKEENTW